MASKLELMQEAIRRGIKLPPDKQALFDEAVRRGLIKDDSGPMIGARSGPSASPAPGAGESSFMGGLKSLGSGVAEGAIGLANGISEIPAWVEGKAASMMGMPPEQLDAIRQARAQLGVGTARSTADAVAKVEEATGPFYKPQGTTEEYIHTAGLFLPGMLAGPGNTFAAGVKAAALPTIAGALGSETAGQATKGTWMEPYARFIGGVGGGLFGGGISNWAGKPPAPIAGVSPGAQARVGNALTDTFASPQEALARGAELGPEAMTLNLGRRPAQQASTIAAYPGESSATIGQAVNRQLKGSGARAMSDWDQAIGPSVSRHENELTAAAAKSGTNSLYDMARGRRVDPSPVHSAILRELTEASNDPQARSALKEAADLLIDPRTGSLAFNPLTGAPSLVGGTQGFINDAGALVNARIRISEAIQKLGKEVSNTPGEDLFAAGRRTSVGSRLNRIRLAINDVLKQDPTLAAADRIWSSAERTRSAFEYGRTKLLGRGDFVVEPESLTARLANPALSVEERAAMARGLSRRGRSLIGDVSPSRNEGKAFGDSIATENNLARIGAVAGERAADQVRGMASREDLFARDAARITGNSTTAERLLGASEFPSPLLGNRQYANIGQRTLLGVGMEGVTRLADALARGAISKGRARLAADAARLLTARGAERDRIVRSLMDYSSSLPKGHPFKAIIAQAVTPSASAALPSLLGN